MYRLSGGKTFLLILCPTESTGAALFIINYHSVNWWV